MIKLIFFILVALWMSAAVTVVLMTAAVFVSLALIAEALIRLIIKWIKNRRRTR